MIYNIELKEINKATNCLNCRFFDKKLKRCQGGKGVVCFEYDDKTMTLIDPVTKLPLNIKGE